MKAVNHSCDWTGQKADITHAIMHDKTRKLTAGTPLYIRIVISNRWCIDLNRFEPVSLFGFDKTVWNLDARLASFNYMLIYLIANCDHILFQTVPQTFMSDRLNPLWCSWIFSTKFLRHSSYCCRRLTPENTLVYLTSRFTYHFRTSKSPISQPTIYLRISELSRGIRNSIWEGPAGRNYTET